jgi:hypothetical protein
MNWKEISERVTDGGHITRAEVLRMIQSHDDELLSVGASLAPGARLNETQTTMETP